MSRAAKRANPLGDTGVCVHYLWAVRPDRILHGGMVATVVAAGDEGGMHHHFRLGDELVLATEAGRKEVSRI